MDTRILDLEGLPEPVARGLEVVAEMARNMAPRPASGGGMTTGLPVWPLGVREPLTREEIYDDDHDRC